MVNYGWICPKCGRVYAPNQEMCLYCGGNAGATEISKIKKPSEGISWLNNYDGITDSTQAINTVDNNQWLSVTNYCDTNTTIDASKVSNTISIDKVELATLTTDTTIKSEKESNE